MDGRGGYAGGDGEEDWGGVGGGRNKRIQRDWNVGEMSSGEDISLFLPKNGAILTAVKTESHRIV